MYDLRRLSILTVSSLLVSTIASAQVSPPVAPAIEAPANEPDPAASEPFVPPANAPTSPTPVSPVPAPTVAPPAATTPTVTAPAAPNQTPPPAYHSAADDLVSIDRVSVLPFTDNMNGIYAKPLEAHFDKLIETQHRWDFVPWASATTTFTPDELEADPSRAIAIGRDAHVDAIFAVRVAKTPEGVDIKLDLFLTRDGKLLSQAVLQKYARFEVSDLKEQTTRLMNEVLSRLPYAGRVLSRDANRVTINLGSQDGIRKDQILNIIQILQLQRHPKFNFLIRTEKEIFGRVRVLKADETLSFATVIMEKEAGAIQKGAKIAPLQDVVYATEGDAVEGVKGDKVAFGDQAKEWKPQAPASLGSVGARLGIGRYTGATSLTDVGGLQASDNASPSITIDGELWITPEWTANARIRQGLIGINNPRDDSSPRKLNASLSLYDLNFGYTIRFGDTATAPSVEPYLGYFLARLYVDDSSPLAFTTSRYQGAKIGIRGSSPLGEGGEWGVGGDFALGISPGLEEEPVTSGGNDSNTAIQFGVLGYKKMGERLRLTGSIEFEMFSTNFSGQGGRGAQSATSASQRYTTVSFGVGYMF